MDLGEKGDGGAWLRFGVEALVAEWVYLQVFSISSPIVAPVPINIKSGGG